MVSVNQDPIVVSEAASLAAFPSYYSLYHHQIHLLYQPFPICHLEHCLSDYNSGHDYGTCTLYTNTHKLKIVKTVQLAETYGGSR
jgi:hypothetical protein